MDTRICCVVGKAVRGERQAQRQRIPEKRQRERTAEGAEEQCSRVHQKLISIVLTGMQ